MENLTGKRIAIIATNGFEKSELLEPKKALEEAGAQTVVVAPERGEIKSWESGNWSEGVKVDLTVAEASPRDYDGLLIPGGTLNCDKLRMDERAVSFVREMFEQNKPIAAICHGPQLLIEAGVCAGRRMTSYNAIKTDLINAGAEWEDSECVVDQGLVTSRSPADIPTFNRKMIEEYAEGEHPREAQFGSLSA